MAGAALRSTLQSMKRYIARAILLLFVGGIIGSVVGGIIGSVSLTLYILARACFELHGLFGGILVLIGISVATAAALTWAINHETAQLNRSRVRCTMRGRGVMRGTRG